MKFNDDMIQRNDLPRDAFELIHDLAYDHEGRERFQYRSRAQAILRLDTGRLKPHNTWQDPEDL